MQTRSSRRRWRLARGRMRWLPYRRTMWLAAAAFVALLALGDALLLGLQYRAELQESENETSVLALVVEEFVRQTILRVDQRIEELVALVPTDVAPEGPWRLGRHAARLREAVAQVAGRDRAITRVEWYDAQGREQAPERPGAGVAQSAATLNAVQEALAFYRAHPGAGLFIGLPAREGKEWRYLLARPVRDRASRLLGIVLVHLHPEVLQRLFGSMEMSKGGVIALLRTDGKVLLRAPGSDSDVGATLAPFPVFSGQRALVTGGMVSGVFSVAGIDRIGYYRAVQGLPLIVAVFVVKDEALAPWWSLLRQNLLIMAGVAAALLALVQLMIRQRERVERAEAVAQAEQERVQAITSRLPCVVFECSRADPAGAGAQFSFVSSGAQELFGLGAPDLLQDARRLRGALVAEDQAGYDLALGQALQTGGEWHHEFRVRTPAPGQPEGMRWVQVSALPRRLEDGSPVWDGMFLDISRQKAAEEQLRRAQSMEAMGYLTRGVAHEFNNVLAVIQGNLELLGLEGAKHEEIAASALRAADRGSALTTRLLSFARRRALRPVASNVNQLLQELSELLKSMLGPRVEIVLRLAPDARPIQADRGELENALIILAVNARDAMPQGGTFTLTTENVLLAAAEPGQTPEREPGPYVRISVSDTGAGMAPEALRHAFDPFFSTKEMGSGLGLSTVYGFVKQSRGDIAIESRQGQGTTVRMALPSPEAAS